MNNRNIIIFSGIALLLLVICSIALPFTDPDAQVIQRDGTSVPLNK